MVDPRILVRLRNVPSRALAAALTFGGILGLPALLALLGAVVGQVSEVAGALLFVLAGLAFFAFVVTAWILIFRAASRIKKAEQALWAADFDRATREAHFVVRTVFRSDYQMGALFVLALSAERLGAFPEAGALFVRALGMIPAMAAQRTGRRARALFLAHAALDFAASGDLARANEMLDRTYRELGVTGQPGALEALLDDSAFGAIGVNTMLRDLENRREPRPLAVLAAMLVAFKHAALPQVLTMASAERASLEHGLAPHERALAERIHGEALRLSSGAGPLRSPGALAPAATAPAAWVDAIVPIGG